MDYEQTLRALFALMAQANMADSVEDRSDWQRSEDADGRDGYYGHLRDAIVRIAGADIVEYWAQTNEIDMALADRGNWYIGPGNLV